MAQGFVSLRVLLVTRSREHTELRDLTSVGPMVAQCCLGERSAMTQSHTSPQSLSNKLTKRITFDLPLCRKDQLSQLWATPGLGIFGNHIGIAMLSDTQHLIHTPLTVRSYCGIDPRLADDTSRAQVGHPPTNPRRPRP